MESARWLQLFCVCAFYPIGVREHVSGCYFRGFDFMDTGWDINALGKVCRSVTNFARAMSLH